MIYTDPDGNLPIVIFAAAALIGGGQNLFSNWSKIKNISSGIGYFLSEAIGGAVSVIDPLSGGLITATANVAMDVATGNLPNFTSGLGVASYIGSTVLTASGVGASGPLTRSAASIGLLGKSAETAISSISLEPVLHQLTALEIAELAAIDYVPSTIYAAGIKQVTQSSLKSIGTAAANAAKTGAQFGENVLSTTTRVGKNGNAVEVLFKNGGKIDINAARVKEWIPNLHPNAPAGTLNKVKFENFLPGSKGFKRTPTSDEIDFLNGLFK